MSTSRADDPTQVAQDIPASVQTMIESLKVDHASVANTDDIFGCEEMKKLLKNSFLDQELPHLAEVDHLQHLFDGTKNILVHGPSRTGKTRLCLSFAKRCRLYSVQPSDIVETRVENTGRNVRALFAVAQENQPCVNFFDKIEGLLGHLSDAICERLKSELLASMSRYPKVVVVGATRLPWLLDRAVLRNLKSRVHLGLPDQSELVEILKKKLSIDGANID